jgi:hypothetical protein
MDSDDNSEQFRAINNHAINSSKADSIFDEPMDWV